jgi:hypothetical protein
MAGHGRGMGIATRGGGAVESGPANKMVSETSKTSGPVMMAKGGMAKGMKAGGVAAKGMMAGGMMAKGMKAGGVAAKGIRMAGGSDEVSRM